LTWGFNTQERKNRKKEKGLKLCIQNQRKKGEEKKASRRFDELQVCSQRVWREDVAGIHRTQVEDPCY